MARVVFLILVCLFTVFPLVGLIISGQLKLQFVFEFSSLIKANFLHVLILLFAVVWAFRTIKLKNYEWRPLHLDPHKVLKVLLRIRNAILLMCVINFILGGIQIFSGVDRGVVRTTLGMWGWLLTFNTLYGVPGLCALATVYYCYFSNKSKRIKYLFYQIIFITLCIALMTGGKANIVLICFAPLLQYAPQLKMKQLFLFLLFGLIAIPIVGMFQMNMSFLQSISYNIYRATSLAAYGTMCVWDFWPNGAEDPYLTLWGVFGTKLTSLFTGTDVNSIEFLDYSMARKITYLYYSMDKALTGTANLTITSFGEAVFWFGRKWYFVLSLFMGMILYHLSVSVFKTRSYTTIKLNILFTVYFTTVFLGWLNSASVASLFGMTTLVYMFLLNIVLRFVLRK